MSAAAAIPSAPLSPFRPAPEAAAAIFSRIASGRESLADLAAAHNTSLEAFALWLESPDAQERLARISAGLASFARIGALARLPAATNTLVSLVEHFTQRCALAAAKPADGSAPVPSPMDDIRERRLIFSAACLILRISRTPDRPRTHPAARDAHSPPSHEGDTAAPAQRSASTLRPDIFLPSRSFAAEYRGERIREAAAAGNRHSASTTSGPSPAPPKAVSASRAAPSSTFSSAAPNTPAAQRAHSPASRAWRKTVADKLAPSLTAEELVQLHESFEQMSDDEICDVIRRGTRHPGALLSAAGAPSGPAP